MPYIKQHIRDQLLNDECAPCTPGELNYCITMTIMNYLGGTVTYGSINEVIGVLECAKMELYRRIAAPYENTKCADNGDVYT